MKWQDNDGELLTVAWFSAGASSAVATKLMIDEIDLIIYTHINDQHEDTMRFVKDCEEWFGKPVQIMQSELKNVQSVVEKTRYVNGPAGASCTRLLKKKVRIDWESENEGKHLRYIWGMDSSEEKRAKRLDETMPQYEHVFPLIDRRIPKQGAHQILKASGIKRPVMYDLGYLNANCVGCLKGGKGYWNKIRVDFPEVFKSRAEMERKVGRSCINGVFLDELDPNRGRKDKPICESCGILCEELNL